MIRKHLAALAILALALPPLQASAQQMTGPSTGAAGRAALGLGMYVPAATDIDPARNLLNCVGKTTCVVAYLGDSTGTSGVTLGNQIDDSQTLPAIVMEELRAKNPGVTFTLANYSIPGADPSWPTKTGTQIGSAATSQPWFTDASKTWLYWVQTGALSSGASPDVLVYGLGTNGSGAGKNASGSSTAIFLNNTFTAVQAWPYLPNPILVTPLETVATDSSDDSASSGHLSQAAFLRTWARSNAKGYTTFTGLQALGFGLIDLGRNFSARVSGFDPASQKLSEKPSCIASGMALAANDVFGSNASTVCTTTNGDFRWSATLPGAGGNVIGSDSASAAAILVSLGQYPGNKLRIEVNASGTFQAKLLIDGAIAGAPVQAGSSITTSNGADVPIVVSATGMRLVVSINGQVSLDTIAPRFIGCPAGGCPINVVWAAAASGTAITVNTTEFADGIAAKTTSIASKADAYGPGPAPPATSCTVTDPGCEGGNSVNHAKAGSHAYDKEVIQALNWHIPPPASASFPGYLASGWYPFGFGTTAGTPLVPGANVAHCYPFSIKKTPLTTAALAITVSTTDAAGHAQVAIYSNGSWGRPSAPIVATGDIATTGGPPLSGAAVARLLPDVPLWACENTDSATVKFISFSATTPLSERSSVLGSATIANAMGNSANITGITVAQTYGTWPTWTSGTAWADDITAVTPRLGMQVGSVP